ncbi:histidine kinase [Brachybacterium paraconglomeratum]|uniref:sensor histidine kinase n=1 Tax=Brachybacterium paraconglomeratum TaxID=173362 RepID=UPI0031E8B679
MTSAPTPRRSSLARALPALFEPKPSEDDGKPPIGARDLLVVAVYSVIVLLLAASGAENSGFLLQGRIWPAEVSTALMLVACASLLWRRRRPVITLIVAGPLSVAEIMVGGQISAYFLLFEALFDPVMHGSRRLAVRTTWAALVLGAAGLLAVLFSGLPGEAVFVLAMIALLVVVTPLLWGWEVRHHRDARQAAEQLAGLEHELAATRAAHAVETERRSIAHDLHDVIAGHLSAVSLHTNLASSLEDRAARDRSLTTARESAHAALRDLRSMIGMLSTAEAGALPDVTLDWPSLTARLHGRDPEAQVSIDPVVADPARVEPAVQAALLRIGAEAVTNAVRHGQAPITLAVRVDAGSVVLELRNRRSAATGLDNSGPGGGTPDSGAPGIGVGRGALSHRAAAVGGSASSGPVAGDGSGAGTGSGSGSHSGSDSWRVLARLPVKAAMPTVALGSEPLVTTPEESRS